MHIFLCIWLDDEEFRVADNLMRMIRIHWHAWCLLDQLKSLSFHTRILRRAVTVLGEFVLKLQIGEVALQNLFLPRFWHLGNNPCLCIIMWSVLSHSVSMIDSSNLLLLVSVFIQNLWLQDMLSSCWSLTLEFHASLSPSKLIAEFTSLLIDLQLLLEVKSLIFSQFQAWQRILKHWVRVEFAIAYLDIKVFCWRISRSKT